MNRVSNLFTNSAKAEAINLSALILDAGTQQRAKVDKATAEDYADKMQNGEAGDFPALWVMRLSVPATLKDGSQLEAGSLVLVDGFHRTEGAILAKLETFQAIVEDGTLEEAIYASMRANSSHGLKLSGKDYQVAIKNLYELDSKWREHGMKKEIAALLGCSEKTVQRATQAYDAAVKAHAFKMFEKGSTDEEVAGYAVISIKTAAAWREEWELQQQEKQAKEANKGNQGSEESQGTDNSATDGNPLNMTLAQLVALKDSAIKAVALKLLMDSMKEQQEAPKDEQQADDEPPFETEEAPKGKPSSDIDELVKAWKGKDWETILGVSLAKLATYASPKAQLKRAFAKQLKKCHPDHYGDNEACEILKEANNQAMASLKREGLNK